MAAEELLFSHVATGPARGGAVHFHHIRSWRLAADTTRVDDLAGDQGQTPVVPGFSLEVVGIEDAARAILLAAERGRVGERFTSSRTAT